MATTFRPPDQLLLLSPDVHEWLPDVHLAYHVGDMVDRLDLTAFYRPETVAGTLLTSPMAKVLVYAYATGVFSSCKNGGTASEIRVFKRQFRHHDFPVDHPV